MVESLKGLLEEWHYGREVLKWFIEKLSEADLDRKLPRRGLDTIRKHCEELLSIQTIYVEALETGVTNFGDFQDDKVLGDTPGKELIKRAEELDKLLEERLKKCHGNETIDWFGEKYIIHRHLSAMTSHEEMHIGQIVAFCYALNITIPKEVINKLVLTG